MGAYIRTGAALRIRKEVEAAKSDELFFEAHTHLRTAWELAACHGHGIMGKDSAVSFQDMLPHRVLHRSTLACREFRQLIRQNNISCNRGIYLHSASQES